VPNAIANRLIKLGVIPPHFMLPEVTPETTLADVQRWPHSETAT